MNRSEPKRSPRTIPGSTDDILAFLDHYGTQNKDAFADASPKRVKKRIEKGKGGLPRMTLDLHGRTGEQASGLLRQMFETCRHHGVKELLVIHGQGHHSNMAEGGPVLKKLVRDMLENECSLQVRDCRPANQREGGDGATLVVLQ